MKAAGGPEFQNISTEYVREHGPVPMGSIAVTDACGNLPCRFVIHTVGPGCNDIKNTSDFTRILPNIYKLIVKKGTEQKFKSLGIHAISSGLLFPLVLSSFSYQFLNKMVLEMHLRLSNDASQRTINKIHKLHNISLLAIYALV